MDDPWDVKSVRQSGQYTSCMKINGIPLLPPLLSKECRKEMQYYKLLAKEVEHRISNLQAYVDVDGSDSSEDKTDATETLECDQENEIKKGCILADFDLDIDHTPFTKEKSLDATLTSSPLHSELYNISSKQVETAGNISPQVMLDLNVNITRTGRNQENKEINPPSPPIEVPERDYNCMKNQELFTDVETKNVLCKQQKNKIVEDILNFNFTVARDRISDVFAHSNQDEPQSLSCKSFTGSLNNIHTESSKGAHKVSKLVRQRSYTVLNPSPQLLAHLEVQSLNLGVDISCISMSDSLSNLSTPSKKRRSWDLETAKVKWSNMALELNKKKLGNANNINMKGQTTLRASSPPRAKSVAVDRTRRSSLSSKPTPKTEPIQKIKRHSPVRNIPSNRTIILEEPLSLRSGKEPKFIKPVKEPNSPKVLNHKKETHEPTSPKTKEPSKVHNKKEPQLSKSPENTTTKVKEFKKSSSPKPQVISASDDPAAKVRELYEKIQKQQLLQMASLVEKQKREQLLLQQVFEEQNNLLFKQLKTICPKSPIEAKEAWLEKTREPDRGPVSLSQLINPKSPEGFNSPLSSTLTESNKNISHCEDVLKKSRDISGSIKKTGVAQMQNGSKVQSPKSQLDSRTRTNSPQRKSTPTSRRLDYDTSASSDHYEPILTDRTNDTMADLNVTFPSDSDDCRPCSRNGLLNHLCGEEVTVIHTSPTPKSSARSTDSAIKCMEQTIQNSINSSYPRLCKPMANYQPTPKQQAAASKIVAQAKGYLVRRLMKTARVQSTVQTIKDALLCALQLHQDREGIRGADVDLHRRLIQQITAACYALHDTFITSTPGERCAMISADRERRSSLANRPPPKHRHSDIMSQSHSGVFPPRAKRFSSSSASLMTQSNYESYSTEKAGRARYMPSPRRRPWR